MMVRCAAVVTWVVVCETCSGDDINAESSGLAGFVRHSSIVGSDHQSAQLSHQTYSNAGINYVFFSVALCYAKVRASHRQRVRPSVCLYVTRWYSLKTDDRTIVRVAFFDTNCHSVRSQKNPPCEGLKPDCSGQNGDKTQSTNKSL